MAAASLRSRSLPIRRDNARGLGFGRAGMPVDSHVSWGSSHFHGTPFTKTDPVVERKGCYRQLLVNPWRPGRTYFSGNAIGVLARSVVIMGFHQ